MMHATIDKRNELSTFKWWLKYTSIVSQIPLIIKLRIEEKRSEITFCACINVQSIWCVFTGAHSALVNIKPQTIKTTTKPSWEIAKGSLCGFRSIKQANSFNEAAMLHMPGNDKVYTGLSNGRHHTTIKVVCSCCSNKVYTDSTVNQNIKTF